MTPYQVNVAAEAQACVVLSQAGYDVAMQYGTTQPDWDIIAKKGERTLLIQVKGSQDGGWGIFQGYMQKDTADYHGALAGWECAQVEGIIYCFVQFSGVEIGSAPRCYVARPAEIVAHMRTTRAGHAYTSLRENYKYTRGVGVGHTDLIPIEWKFSRERIERI